MTKIAYLFPGQGSQVVGMGQDLFAQSPAAKAIFDEADSYLETKLSSLCFFGPEATLKLTVNTQPALFVVSVATLMALREAGAPPPFAAAGHSIGEYAALVAADALDFSTGLRLVDRRAHAMHRATLTTQGEMAAILGLSSDAVAALCGETSDVYAANFNGGGQVVISGTPEGIARASELAKSRGAKRVVPLPVSGAFHSPLMTPAAEFMVSALESEAISDARIPVVANLTADYETSAADIKANLAAQIDHSVRWEESMQRLLADGFDTFLEVGAGSVLTGLMKRIAPDAKIVRVGDSAGVAAAAALT